MTEEEQDLAMAVAAELVNMLDPQMNDVVKLRALAFVVGASCLAANGGDIKNAKRDLKSIMAVAKYDMQRIAYDPHLQRPHEGMQ